MKNYVKQLMLKEKFETKNIIAVLEMIEESGICDIDNIINLLINGIPKRKLDIDKIYNKCKSYTDIYYKDDKITFTNIKINELTDIIRVFFKRNNSPYEDYNDIYNIEEYCNE